MLTCLLCIQCQDTSNAIPEFQNCYFFYKKQLTHSPNPQNLHKLVKSVWHRAQQIISHFPGKCGRLWERYPVPPYQAPHYSFKRFSIASLLISAPEISGKRFSLHFV
jgi:hypothetical protein